MAQLEQKIGLYTTKVTKSGNYYEVRKYELPVLHGFTAADRRKPVRKSTERRSDNVSRARNRLIRRVLANSESTKPLFLTLTYESNMEDRDQAKEDFKRFIRFMRSVYGKVDYVYVLETQERGAWHIHVLIFNRSFMRINLVRLIWQHIIAEKARVNIKQTNDSKHVAFYLGKYLGKEVIEPGKRLYSLSRGLQGSQEYKHNFFRDRYSLFIPGECIYSGGYFTQTGNFVNVDIYYENKSSTT